MIYALCILGGIAIGVIVGVLVFVWAINRFGGPNF